MEQNNFWDLFKVNHGRKYKHYGVSFVYEDLRDIGWYNKESMAERSSWKKLDKWVSKIKFATFVYLPDF